MASNKSPYTKTLNNATLVITADMGFTQISILSISGTLTILGQGLAGQGNSPDAITIPNDQGITIGNPNSSLILNGITIDSSAGNTIICAL